MGNFKKKSFGDKLRSRGYSSYDVYLASDHWQNVRKSYFKSTRPKSCWCCGARNHLQLHHKTYNRLGREKLTDLILLCGKCHEEVHKRLRAKSGLRLWTAASVLRSEKVRNGAFIGDPRLGSLRGVSVKFVDPSNL